jgi:hypothetical protein
MPPIADFPGSEATAGRKRNRKIGERIEKAVRARAQGGGISQNLKTAKKFLDEKGMSLDL